MVQAGFKAYKMKFYQNFFKDKKEKEKSIVFILQALSLCVVGMML